MNVFLSIDAPDVKNRMAHLSTVNDPVELRRVNQLTELARRIWSSWALKNGGTVLTEDGAAVRIELPADYIDELQDLKDQYGHALDSRVAVGVGTEVHQADRAMEAVKVLGGDMVLPYSEYVEQALDKKPEPSALESIAKAQAPVAMNQGAFSGAHRPTGATVEKPTASQGEHSEAQSVYDTINDDDRPPAPEGTHAAQDFEEQLHGHAQAQDDKDKQAAHQSSSDVIAVKQKIAQALQLLQAQAPVMEQIKQSSPDTYQAMVTLAQSVVELARSMRGEPMQKAEKPRVTAGKHPMRADDGDIYRYVSDIHTGSRADLNKVPMDTRFHLLDVPLAKLPALRSPDNAQVQQYASMKTPFPPIVIGRGGSIPDGHHRIAAARLRGDQSIRAYVPEAEVGGYAVAKKAPAKKPVKKMKKAEFVEGDYPEFADDVEVYEYFRKMHMGGRGNLVKSVPYGQEYKLVVLPVAELVSGVPMDNAVAQTYASMPTPFPPIIMKTEGAQPLDGNHRLTAARIRGEQTIRAYVPLGKSDGPFEEPLAKMALIHDDASKPMSVWRVEDEDGEGPYGHNAPLVAQNAALKNHKWKGENPQPSLGSDFSESDLAAFNAAKDHNKVSAFKFGFESPDHAHAWFGPEHIQKLTSYGYQLKQVPAAKVYRSQSGKQVFFLPHQEMRKNENGLAGLPHGTVLAFQEGGRFGRQRYAIKHGDAWHGLESFKTARDRHFGKLGAPLPPDVLPSHLAAGTLNMVAPGVSIGERIEHPAQLEGLPVGATVTHAAFPGKTYTRTANGLSDGAKEIASDYFDDMAHLAPGLVYATDGRMSKEELEKAKLPMPEASSHHHQILPVGSRVDYKQKVAHGDGSTSWVQMRAGQIMSQDGHAISSRNPKGR